MKDIRRSGRLEFTVDDIGYVKVMRSKDFTVPYRRGKEKYSIILPINGSMRYFFPETRSEILLYPGDVMYIPKKCPYIATYLVDDTAMRLFNFDISTIVPPEGLSEPQKRTLPELVHSIGNDADRYSDSTMYLAAKVYELLSALVRQDSEIPKEYRRIMPALEEIERSYTENRRMSHYAALCSMSESNFRRLFKAYTGKSPIEYRNTLRVIHARKLIESGEFTVSESAYMTGFNNLAFFYEVYNGYRKGR